MKFKSYEQFNESMADFFKSAHAAIDPDDLIPLENLIGHPKFPTQEEFDEAVEYLDIEPEFLYYNPKDIISPIMYWDGPIYEPLHRGLNMEALRMMRVKDRLDYKKKDVKKFLDSKDYDRLFTFMDKKILIPSFIKMYDDIPDKDKYEIFKDLYVRSEYGFQSFPIEIIKDCFSRRKLSSEWKKRIEEFSKTVKLNADGAFTVYRGENVDSAKGDDAFSWTLNKKTAKFFADRFSKGSGRITEKTIKPEEVIDFLEDRGEAEIILFPKKFGKINEEFLNEKLETKEEFEEKCTHYIWKDIPRKEKYTGHLVQISDDFGRGRPNIPKDYENKVIVRDPRSNEYNTSVTQFNMSDEDVKKYFKPITSTYLNSKKFGL
jgi:hypothetical protein